MSNEPYPTDLTDEEWELIEPFLRRKSGQSGQQLYHPRRMVDANLALQLRPALEVGLLGESLVTSPPGRPSNHEGWFDLTLG